MRVREQLKHEIDQVDERYLELSFNVVRQFPPATQLGKTDYNNPLVQTWERMDTSTWTDSQKIAHQQMIDALKISPEQRSRQFGIGAGLVEISDDFDTPLPPEIEELFWGSQTDQFGMMLQSDEQ